MHWHYQGTTMYQAKIGTVPDLKLGTAEIEKVVHNLRIETALNQADSLDLVSTNQNKQMVVVAKDLLSMIGLLRPTVHSLSCACRSTNVVASKIIILFWMKNDA